jgi:hypothetical protein
VLDPWNGSGTTTRVAHSLGHEAIGFDLNPVLTVIARARLLDLALTPSVKALAADIVRHSRDLETVPEGPDRLLGFIFDSETVPVVWSLVCAIHQVLVEDGTEPAAPVNVEKLTALASFFLVALFDVVRQATTSFKASNPTWTRLRNRTPIHLDRDRLEADFDRAVHSIAGRLQTSSWSDAKATIGTSPASLLPLEDHSVDLVVTSPPYCTRIDYAVATLPELAVLGWDRPAFDQLRESMLGSPITKGRGQASDDAWGSTALGFLKQVAAHESKASATYYTYYFQRYFSGLSSSLRELNRVAKPRARMAFVLQDSYYKQIHLDLAAVAVEMLGSRNWCLIGGADFSTRTLAAVNPGARKYRGTFTASESVLLLSRQAIEV